MKDKFVDEPVIAELKQLSIRIRELCIENHMPCVVSFAYKKGISESGIACTKALTAYVNEGNNAFNESIVAAILFLKTNNIPRDSLDMIEDLANSLDSAGSHQEQSTVH
ncbi:MULTISPECIES: hypothetical protein [Cronobacter]|uniref:hypothetical protein n=1 Tax=Cronobacter TaxID=413496 RepID=UPI000BE8E2A7|nr:MULTISPECIES: hypothetical protein [Cronobacter]ELY2772893.1 hypothetical protein [Cronobacter sakazakii]PQV87157.1 hypothetical protein CDT99_04760 [Cronobacter sakazakii]HDK7323796.1 hypothetical protein [Cronobacter sakazakii]HDK7392566.1 hypothetical protein [Cronobacter sakazakii]